MLAATQRGTNPLQFGVSFIFAPGNRDPYVHLSRTFGDNADVGMLLAVFSR